MSNKLIKEIEEASKRLEGVVKRTPLEYSKRLSSLYNADIYLKREDLQEVRSYKIRGAYNLMKSSLSLAKERGVVCASAGNHSQGVAFSASLLKVKSVIFMPKTTPNQKITRVKHFGGKWVDINLSGLNYDESCKAAKAFCKEKGSLFVHPFDDEKTIAGQGTVGKEIYEELKADYVFCPIGGGGLASGVASYLKNKDDKIKIIGVEPLGASGMKESIKRGRVVSLSSLNSFVDGAAVKKVGKKTFKILSNLIDRIEVIEEGKVSSLMIDLYQNEGIVTEPAGALSVSALDNVDIKGKKVVCILSGGNNDILRYPEIMEKSLLYQGRKHYFMIRFAQKPGQLKRFVNEVLGPNDDIVRFEYMKKTSKEKGPTLVGIELLKKEDYSLLIERMDKLKIEYSLIKEGDMLYNYLI